MGSVGITVDQMKRDGFKKLQEAEELLCCWNRLSMVCYPGHGSWLPEQSWD